MDEGTYPSCPAFQELGLEIWCGEVLRIGYPHVFQVLFVQVCVHGKHDL